MQKAHKPIEIKISTVVAISAILHETDPAALDKALKDMTGGVSDFFEDEFAVLDIGALDAAGAGIDWAALVALFKRYRLNAVAVRNAPEELHAEIAAQGLSIDGGAPRPQQQEAASAAPVEEAPKPAPAPAAAAPVQAPAAPAAATMIIDTPVRAGQRIYARGADLVIMAAVNNGAEIIADGSIHVYAPLRGRALAGASGNTGARIFAASLEAELVSIAGVYRTFENGHPPELAQQQVQVRLTGDRIDVLPINTSK
ncbi:septum site-determining protein MinC [Herbaspirillum sp. RV1423]|uniref:septum site-determining protein MinC n=1 Tax=Herbaspirillum sp. RV1423 TaxID=1443993 RepID=UPI0004B70781|nr:septum site-determining protein MinC [Herbaspirillum sp. RV1423]